eukprot:425892-Alexandrium_andersonii.AAC.1
MGVPDFGTVTSWCRTSGPETPLRVNCFHLLPGGTFNCAGTVLTLRSGLGIHASWGMRSRGSGNSLQDTTHT